MIVTVKVQVKATPVFLLSCYAICFQRILAGVPSKVAKISTRVEGKSSLSLYIYSSTKIANYYTDEYPVKIGKLEANDNITGISRFLAQFGRFLTKRLCMKVSTCINKRIKGVSF